VSTTRARAANDRRPTRTLTFGVTFKFCTH